MTEPQTLCIALYDFPAECSKCGGRRLRMALNATIKNDALDTDGYMVYCLECHHAMYRINEEKTELLAKLGWKDNVHAKTWLERNA